MKLNTKESDLKYIKKTHTKKAGDLCNIFIKKYSLLIQNLLI